MNSTTSHEQALLGLTAQIVSAHLHHNKVPATELALLIREVHAALASAGTAPAPVQPAEQPAKPAPLVAPKRTIFNDYIICLEDGRKLKTLKRHLSSTFNMSPDQYREKWGLPPDYPMVAPSYAERRSTLAKSLGLGRKAAKQAEPAPELDLDDRPLPQMPRFIIASAPAPRAAPTPPPQSAAAPEPEVAPAPHAAKSGAEPTLESVFGRAGTPAPAQKASPPADEPGGRKAQRKPFSKQLARTMRP